MLSGVLLAIFPLLLMVAAIYDLLTMTIPNKLNGLLLLGFVVCTLIVQPPLMSVAAAIGVALVVFFLGFAVFALGQMGGGDVKLMSVICLWFGYTVHSLEFFVLASVYGGILSIAVWIFRRHFVLPKFALGQQWLVNIYEHTKFPYGITIAIAGIQVYPTSQWFAQLSSL